MQRSTQETKPPPTFDEWAQRSLPQFPLHAWQRDVLCPLLQRLAGETGVRVAIHAPPQYGKSILVSQRLPAYLLGVDPLHRVGLACYNETRATDFGQVVKVLMLAPQYAEQFPDPRCRIREDCAAGKFYTAGRLALHDGQPSFVAMGLQSGFTGRGVDTLIIDDPYKSSDEADSDVIREKVWRFWEATASPRIGEAANVVVMFHRYREDDFAGRLLAEGGWEYIRLPAIADANEDGSDPTGRRPGELLSPMRSAAWLAAQKAGAPRVFVSQFQGRPRPEEGALFKQSWFNTFTREGDCYVLLRGERLEKVRAEDCWRFSVVDWAASEKTTADWTVVATYAVTPRRDLLLLEVVRERREGPEAKGLVRDVYRRQQPAYVACERNGLGNPLTQDLIREGLPIRGVFQDRDKVARAQGSAARYEAGTVFHRAGAPWLDLWEGEHLSFPNAAHDDQVDCGALAAVQVAGVSAILSEFSPALHVALQPLEADPELVLVCGWAGEPTLAFCALQLTLEGQLLVLGGGTAKSGEGAETFRDAVATWLERRVAAPLGRELGSLDLKHYGPPAWLTSSKSAVEGMSLRRALGPGTRRATHLNEDGDVEQERRGHGWRLLAGEESDTTRLQVLRSFLSGLVGPGLPAFVVDSRATHVIEALSGGFCYRQSLTTGELLPEAESNRHSALVEALGHAACRLPRARPKLTEERREDLPSWNETWECGPRGGGRRRRDHSL